MEQAAENPTVSLTRTQREVHERLRDEMALAMESLRAEMAQSGAQERAAAAPRMEWVAERSPSRWKWMTGGVAGGVAVVALTAGGAWLALGEGGGSNPPPPPPPTNTAAPAQPGVTCETTTDWAFMVNCDGKQVTAKGPVAGASYQASVTGKPTFVNIGNDFPDTRRLEVVIWGNCRANFSTPPETLIEGRLSTSPGRSRCGTAWRGYKSATRIR